MIGATYIYCTDPDQKQFILEKIDGFIFRFKGGHWCTDEIFKDFLIQITLF